MVKKSHRSEMMSCPVARFFSDLEKISGRKSPFFGHLKSSRIEFLKAVRSLFDARIDSLEKMGPRSGKKISETEAG